MGIARAAVLSLLLASLAGCGDNEPLHSVLGTLERDRLELPAEANEPIVDIAVREGARVTAGQILLKLDGAHQDMRLASQRAKVSAAQHRLTELTRGPRREEITQVRAQLKGAESRLANESRELQRLEELLTRKLVAVAALDRQRAVQETAQATVEELRARLALLLAGTRNEELDQARDVLADANAQLEQLQLGAERLIVRAPRAGVIEALPYKLGERPAAGAVVLIMLAEGAPYARVYVPETLRAAVKPGTEAQVHVDGVAETLQGRVRYIAAEASFTPYFALNQKDRSRLSYLAEVVLTQPQAERLPSGIPVEVNFEPGTGAASVPSSADPSVHHSTNERAAATPAPAGS